MKKQEVSEPWPYTQRDIRKRVVEALAQNKETSSAGINVIDENGVIRLSGQVEGAEVKERAEMIAVQQPGVVSVVNSLSVRK